MLADAVPPSVTITPTVASPTNAASVSFQLVFSEPVSGLQANDISVAPGTGAASGCAIGEPTGSGTTYSLTLVSCGEGTVGLVLAANSVLGEGGASGPAEQATSAAVVIDRTSPAVTTFAASTPSPVGGTQIDYDLALSEPVTGLASADFTISGTSSGWSVSSVTGADTTYAVKLTAPSVVSGSVVLTLAGQSVIDAAGNAGPPAAVAAPVVTVTAPPAASATITINGGASSTADPALKLAITATGFGTNLQVRFSVDGGKTWTPYEAFVATRTLNLPAKWRWGNIVVTAQLRDGAATSVVATDAIDYVRADRSSMALRPSYLLRATLNYAKARLVTHQTVDITNASGGLVGYLDFSVLARHYGEMAIRSVEVDGVAVGASFTNSANMRLPLGFNLRPGEGARVSISFTATAKRSVSDHLRSRFAKANGLMQISSWHPVLSDGHGLRSPGDSQFTVAADYRLELTHPSSVVIAAPGRVVSSSATRKVYTLTNAREYAFAASPGFRRTDARTRTGVTVSVYYLPGTRGVATARSVSVRALERMAPLFGAYPYDRFVVAPGARSTVGLEYSGVVFIGARSFGYRLMLAHEVAHQWWYGVVGNDQLAEPWLDEAFAEFIARHLFGYPVPPYCSTRPVDSSVTAFTTTWGCEQYQETVYHKGAAFLNSMRLRMGDAAFFNALRAIATENRFGVVSTSDVRAAFLRYSADTAAINAYMDGFLATR